AGYVGLPQAVGGSNWFERFLAPRFGLEAMEAVEKPGVETTLMVVSSTVAVAGIGIAVFFFLKNREAARLTAERFGGIRRLLEEKYYVDEIYDAAVVQPVRIVSQDGLWKA